ncbi:MAG: AI-2E family transporter [Longimicrobiales bacterium]
MAHPGPRGYSWARRTPRARRRLAHAADPYCVSADPPSMIFDRTEQNPGARFIFLLASLVVVVYGVKFAAPVLVPSAMALFLAILSLPVMTFLGRHRVPGWLALTVSILLDVGVFGLVLLLAAGSVVQFQERIPEYAESLNALQVILIQALESRTGLTIGEAGGPALVNPAFIVDLARRAVGYSVQFATTTVLVFIVMSFMLSEATIFPDKIRFLRGGVAPMNERATRVVEQVQSYLRIKTLVSAATGLLLGFWCWFLDLDFPVLLGLTAFILNFVPTVGSILAAVPAVLLSLVIYGSPGHALAVAGGYVMVNMVLGNIIEPQLQGNRLGLSTVVVVLSLLFWGWAWGPIGALLSVPLTNMVKIWMENTKDLQWVAVLLDSRAPKLPQAGGPQPAAP